MGLRKLVAAAVLLAMFAAGQAAQADPHRLGGGVRYNRAVSSFGDGFDSDGLSFLVSYQYAAAELLKLEGDVEFMPSSLTGDGMAIIPQVYALLGSGLYAGIGIGLPYYDGEFGSDPIYGIRLGIDFALSKIHLDLNANYGFSDFDQLSDFETDNITLALVGRYEF